jgi:hypothetical protein
MNALRELVTQGGRFGGWGLLLMDGKPEFDYAFSNRKQHKYRVASKEKLAAGKHTIKFDFKYDGPGIGKSGAGTLSVRDLLPIASAADWTRQRRLWRRLWEACGCIGRRGESVGPGYAAGDLGDG